jgi:hypothetical protein
VVHVMNSREEMWSRQAFVSIVRVGGSKIRIWVDHNVSESIVRNIIKVAISLTLEERACSA